jgi:hypothetical protein
MGGQLGGSDEATRVALLTGSMTAAQKKQIRAEVASGQVGIVVGTHALLQDAVEFHNLGMVVVDEQHRFGVEQRDALRAKAEKPPHLLVMTATPIPRTVAMTAFGDLETSVLAELPLRRSPRSSFRLPTNRTTSRAPGTGSARRSPPGTRPTSSARESGKARKPAATKRAATKLRTRRRPRNRLRQGGEATGTTRTPTAAITTTTPTESTTTPEPSPSSKGRHSSHSTTSPRPRQSLVRRSPSSTWPGN